LNLVVLGLITLVVALDPGFVRAARAIDSGAFTLAPFLKTAFLATRWGLPGQGEWNEPVWSLSAEILGYLAFPALAWLLTRRASPITAASIAIGALGLLAVVQIVTRTGGVNMSGLIRMACGLVAGAALAQVFHHGHAILKGFAPWTAALAVGLIAAIALTRRCEWAMMGGFALLVLSLAYEGGAVSAFLSSPPALFLGRISFPLYLGHLTPLAWLGFHVSGLRLTPVAGGLWLFGYLMFAIAGAYALHRWIERPTHRLGRRWAALAGQRLKLVPRLQPSL
jgi:peptidoglycan/LPS O-acetylase OafA/YrhL